MIVTRIKWIVALAALTLVLVAVPALADEADDDEGEASVHLEHNSPLALLLATEFGIDAEEVASLRQMGLGFGDIFKLTTLSSALGVDMDALLASASVDAETGEYDFAWGEFKQALTAEQLALLVSFPKNLGAIVSAENRHHGRDEHHSDATAGEPTRHRKSGKHANEG